MAVISVSTRTDVPAFYSKWFFDCLKKEMTVIRLPYSDKKKEISLAKPDVDCFVFWTKDPRPMFPRMNELDGYSYYFQHTITGYGSDIEPGISLEDKKKMPETFTELSKLCKGYAVWRYDPVFISPKYTLEYHKKAFSNIAHRVKGYTKRCVISFLDIYPKIQSNLDKHGIRTLNNDEIKEFSEYISSVANECGFEIFTCAEEHDLQQYGIKHSHCIDKEFIEEVSGRQLPDTKKKPNRPLCGCYPHIDIGAYHTCKHGCVYCYAM